MSIDFSFAVERTDTNTAARAASFTTAHGTTETPVFMPVATHAVFRGFPTEDFKQLGYTTILANTYHLLLRPGAEVFENAGGIHPFMQWPHSVLTDSGGFQIFSLSKHLKLSEEGASFRSYVDGKIILLTPERSIAMQRAINSDIMMVLDQCVPSLSDARTARDALMLTHRWAGRSFEARGDSRQALFGIVQGACFFDLRKTSAEQITGIPFDGYAVGGVAVGDDKKIRDEIIAYTASLLPVEKPRYLMGVGTPLDILEAVSRGIDMFDCILPTAHAQQGVCYLSTGKIDLRRGVYRFSNDPLDANCDCHTCRTYTRSYLHHLIKIGEFVGGSLLSLHNLTFYKKLMQRIRAEIIGGSFEAYYKAQRELLGRSDDEFPPVAPPRRNKRTPRSLGSYEVVERDGIASIRHMASGEVMHSVTAPDIEAELLYVAQSRLRQRVIERPDEPLTVWDVGLGAAHNAMATLKAYKQCAVDHPVATLQIISFENDLDSLRLALQHPQLFPHIRHAAPNAIVRDGVWRSKSLQIEWRLLRGDFTDTIAAAPVPELIFFDPFSYKTNGGFWTRDSFLLMKTRSVINRTKLFSYTAATSARAAMLAAGWYVAKGIAMPPKDETTVALLLSERSNASYDLLGEAWLERWKRSGNRLPLGTRYEEEREVENSIIHHPQFSNHS